MLVTGSRDWTNATMVAAGATVCLAFIRDHSRGTSHTAQLAEAVGETTITVVGNLAADPELRYTPSGTAVANFTVASTPRTFDRPGSFSS